MNDTILYNDFVALPNLTASSAPTRKAAPAILTRRTFGPPLVDSEFFDPRDLIQGEYAMLRRA